MDLFLSPPPPNFYFGFQSSNLAQIFREGVSQARYLTIKISARNIESTKIYLKIKGQNMCIRVSHISLPFQMLESSSWF
jgi:hypothetical protein